LVFQSEGLKTFQNKAQMRTFAPEGGK